MAGYIKKALLLALAAPVMLLGACTPEAEALTTMPSSEPATNISQPVPVPTVEILPSPAVAEPAAVLPRLTHKPVISSAWENTEFGFTLEYGLTGEPKTLIDTVNYTYGTSDKNIALVFTDDELAEILRRMNEIDFFDYPEVLKGKPDSPNPTSREPCYEYHFRVKHGTEYKTLSWKDEYYPYSSELADRLRLLMLFIQDLAEIKAGERPDADFGFVFNWGVGPGDTLDTFHGTYTRDMVKDPPVSANLTLTDEEMALIEAKMLEIGLFDYPRYLVTGYSVVPSGHLSLKIKCGVVFQEIYWLESYGQDDEQADKLIELISLIQEIIRSKPEYQQLPSPRFLYL